MIIMNESLIFMVHPLYAHICMGMRIIYVECKNEENKIFTFWYKSYILILQIRSLKQTAQKRIPVVYVFKQKVSFSANVHTLRMITMGPLELDVDCSRQA